MAEALYAGIMTDTGNFRHPSTSPRVHIIVAELMELGADVSRVSNLIYDNNSLDRIKLLGFALLERLYVDHNSQTAYFVLSIADQNRFNYQTGDTEGLVNYALSIKGINMAAILIEKEDMIKLSFRSVGNISVNEFARQHFNGGGHKNAAGGTSNLSLQETIIKFKELISRHSSELIRH